MFHLLNYLIAWRGLCWRFGCDGTADTSRFPEPRRALARFRAAPLSHPSRSRPGTASGRSPGCRVRICSLPRVTCAGTLPGLGAAKGRGRVCGLQRQPVRNRGSSRASCARLHASLLGTVIPKSSRERESTRKPSAEDGATYLGPAHTAILPRGDVRSWPGHATGEP